jgi:hypothetical protein
MSTDCDALLLSSFLFLFGFSSFLLLDDVRFGCFSSFDDETEGALLLTTGLVFCFCVMDPVGVVEVGVAGTVTVVTGTLVELL